MNQLITRSEKMMGTTITVSLVQLPGQATVACNDAVEGAFGEFARIVKQFTRFNEDSELSNLNRRSGKWTQVSQELFDLVRTMLELSKATDGAFDPTVIDYLETYGYDPNYNFSKLENPDLDSSVKKLAAGRASWQEIELNKDEHSIKLAEKQRLDLGGLGKGYAIDCAAKHLEPFGNYCIDAGGDIRVLGNNAEGKPWKLSLRHKLKDGKESSLTTAADWSPTSRPIGVIESTNIAIACSGSWARKVKQFHHIIDPVSGAPVAGLATVYVAAPTAALADGWSTALFVAGPELLKKLPEGLSAMLIDEEDKVSFLDKHNIFVDKEVQEHLRDHHHDLGDGEDNS